MFKKKKKISANYEYLKLQFNLLINVGSSDNEFGYRVEVRNMETGYSWTTSCEYAAAFLLTGFKNIETNERLLPFDGSRKLFEKSLVECFEGFFPADQLVFQQMKSLTWSLEQLPDYEIHQDQRARIPIGLGSRKLWLAVINEDDLANLEKCKVRRGDLVISVRPEPTADTPPVRD